MRILTLMTAVFLSAAIAGCVADDQLGSGDAELAYEGNEAGQESENADCNEDGQVSVTTAIESGSLQLSVLDAQGNETFSDTYEGNLDAETESVEGAPGEWTIEVTRTEGFDGSYTVVLGC